jgi:AcrR family transcriptional regulator
VPRTKQRTPQLRDAVVRTAVDLLVADGVIAFSTRRVAQAAGTSIPAIYELFGDRAGLVREVYLDGFRGLQTALDALASTVDVRADLSTVIMTIRRFVRQNPALAEVMFARPFPDYSPGAEEVRATAPVRELVVGRVRRCIEAGVIAGDETDIAHVLLALALGLAAQEAAGWLGSSKASRDHRWALGIQATLAGFASATAVRPTPSR